MITDWNNILQEEKQKPYFHFLQTFVDNEYKNYICYPPKQDIFNALKLTPFNNTRVIILAQDPYINPNQAHGLAFSVLCNKLPPSLKNIYKEIESDLGIEMAKNNGDLTPWTNQGVLLLNTVLTVRAGESNSHAKKGWEKFTDRIIQELGEDNTPKVFILWGRNAQEKESLITNKKHLILKAAHPSPLSAYNGFFGCKHFSKANEFLIKNWGKEINWQIKDKE